MNWIIFDLFVNILDMFLVIYICKYLLNYNWRGKKVYKIYPLVILYIVIGYIMEVRDISYFGLVHFLLLSGCLYMLFREKLMCLGITVFTLENLITLMEISIQALAGCFINELSILKSGEYATEFLTYLLITGLVFALKRWCAYRWGSERVVVSWISFILLIACIFIDLLFLAWMLESGEIQKEVSESMIKKIVLCVFVFALLVQIGIILFMIREQIWGQKCMLLSQRISEMKIGQYRSILEQNEEIRKYRHDMKNHFFLVSNYIREGKQKEALSYLGKLQDSSAFQSNPYYSGWPVLDIMLQDAVKKAEERGIGFSYEGAVNRELPFEDMDMCVLFGNLLNNALEAAEKCQDGNRGIWLEVRIAQHSMLVQCANSISEQAKQTLLQGMEQGMTTKADVENHGIGMGNIRDIVSKYHGSMSIEIEERFVVRVQCQSQEL